MELRRAIGYVFQGIGLFPHMTVRQNIELVPRLLGWPAEKRRRRALELLDLVDLPPSTPSACRGASPAASSSGSVWPGRWPAGLLYIVGMTTAWSL